VFQNALALCQRAPYSFDFWLQKDMRKSSSPSLSNCNSVLANKIFGIPLDELQQEGQPDNEVPFIVRHVVDYIEEHGGLEQEGLFQVNGNAETVEWLRQRYDNGEDVDLVKEADVPSAISLLRFFLQEPSGSGADQGRGNFLVWAAEVAEAGALQGCVGQKLLEPLGGSCQAGRSFPRLHLCR
uniref:Rho-GAP domain-containing protein n=1 Tax=Athene cunicularia TaxID=194338 RepID=A0A663MVV3_ATHCN